MSFRLLHLSGSQAGQARTLADGEEVLLGRDPADAQVVFGTDDRVVSRRHATVRLKDGVLTVRDLESSTGTFVDGQSIEEAELQEGDIFELGPGGPRLQLVAGDGDGDTLVRARPVDAATEARLVLTIASGRRAGESIEPGGRVVRLGRAPANSVAFPDDSAVSAQHAKIVRLDDGYVVIDLESTNGTFVNGQSVSRARLNSSDVLVLGTGGPQVRVEIRRHGGAGGTVVVPNFGALAARRAEGVLVRELELPEAGLEIGRGPRAGLRLESPIISLSHARLSPQGAAIVVEDLGSANGTYVNGVRIERRPVGEGDFIVVGPFQLEMEGRRVRVLDTRRRTEVRAHDLVVTAAGRRVLDGVSLTLAPGSFTAIIGPSGSGKSTLLRALSAARPAESGRVLVNDLPLHAARSDLAGLIGYVPQDDIVHRELTPAECLDFAARLRLPASWTAVQRAQRVADVLATLELAERRNVPIHRLSGGQRKRVSIAVELLTEPDVLFLDEPTSGLDPGLEESLMLLLRELSFKGKTVVIVTHTLDHLALCDTLVAVVGGRLAFDGRPAQAPAFFGIAHLAQLYSRLKERPDAEWATAFDAQRAQTPAPPPAPPRPSPRPAPTLGGFRALGVLGARYVKTLTRDRRNAVLLLAQAPLVATLIGLSMLYGAGDLAFTKPTNTVLFLLTLVAVWFGCSNAARELVKERAVVARERMVGLRPFDYVASKVVVLSVLALVQCAVSLAILGPWFRVPGDRVALLAALWLASVVGVLLGLVVSAFARTTDRATTVLPIVLIPQVLFTFPAVQLDMKGPAGIVAHAMPTWWAFDLVRRVALAPDARESDDAIEARLRAGRPVLMTRARFESLLREGYPMWNYRPAVEMTWTATGPERSGHPVRTDAAALAAMGLGLFVLAVGRESARRRDDDDD